MSAPSLDVSSIVMLLVKCALEAAAIVVGGHLLAGKPLKLNSVAMLVALLAAGLAVLDMYAPSVSSAVRMGAGFGLGAKIVGFP